MRGKQKNRKVVRGILLLFAVSMMMCVVLTKNIKAFNVDGEKSEYGIVGNMTGWAYDLPMYETEEGVFVGSTGVIRKGKYEFCVRRNGVWDETWSSFTILL